MNKTSAPVIMEAISALPWAMERKTLTSFADLISRHAAGVRLSADEVAAVVAARNPDSTVDRGYRIENSAAIVPVSGVIAKHARQVNGASQPRGTSVEVLNKALAKAVADDRAKRIVLHIESPGGSVAGLADFADAVYDANAAKPVIAYADDLCASAAYWIGSQASRFYCNQTAMVGSIGVYALMLDSSRAAQNQGFRFVIVRSGPHKGVGETGVPITDSNVEAYQTEIDRYFATFKSAVMRGRGPRGLTSGSLDELADGRCFIGAAAVDLKLVDGVKTLAQAVASYAPRPRAASEEIAETTASSRSAIEIENDLGPAAHDNPEIEVDGDKTMNKDEKSTQADAAATDAAVAAERDRASAVSKILAGRPELLEKAIADSACGPTEAAAMLVPALEARIADLEQANASLQARLDEIAQSGASALRIAASDDEAPPADESQAPTGDDGKCATYVAAVKAAAASGKTLGDAYAAAGDRLPESHAAYIAAGSPRIDLG